MASRRGTWGNWPCFEGVDGGDEGVRCPSVFVLGAKWTRLLLSGDPGSSSVVLEDCGDPGDRSSGVVGACVASGERVSSKEREFWT